MSAPGPTALAGSSAKLLSLSAPSTDHGPVLYISSLVSFRGCSDDGQIRPPENLYRETDDLT